MENQESEVIPVEVVTQPVEQQKVKNPKRIEAGKKGAAARKAKRQDAQDAAKQDVAKQDENEITKITIGEEEPEKIKINVYKNYIPPCLVLLGIAGLGLYIYNKKSATQPVAVQPVPAVAPKDPFDF